MEDPVTVIPIEGTVSLSKPIVDQYLSEAQAAYRTEAYADYTTSVVGNYSTTAARMNDIPLPITLSWTRNGNGNPTYTVTLATDAAFTENVCTYVTKKTTLNVYNLLVNTTYYYKVKATVADGQSFESARASFKTANTVRWINVDGVRNVRDIGGWTGLNQGLVFRGSELNQTQSYGTAITEEGIRTMCEDIGIRTHLDFRPAASNAPFGSDSPLGEDVTWANAPLAAFLSAFNAGNGYTTAMKVFTDYDNYPVYMHCVGGADRTGTVAFMLEGLCGVEEADLSIELELTSFSKFGYRYRYDNSTYIFATVVERVKGYSGNSLQEKFETIFREVYGFSEAEISNVRAILTQNGAVYDFNENENGDILPEVFADGKFAFRLTMRNSKAVSSIKVGNVALDFDFDPTTSTLTVYTENLENSSILSGIGTITFDDGAFLRFYIETPNAERVVSEIVDGAYEKIFNDGEASANGNDFTVKHKGNFV